MEFVVCFRIKTHFPLYCVYVHVRLFLKKKKINKKKEKDKKFLQFSVIK